MPEQLWGCFEADCYACDLYGLVNDLFLCEECAGKLERDLLRQRDWDYAATAYGLSSDQRENVRSQVIARYGKKLELIAPANETPREPSKKKQMKAERRRRKRAEMRDRKAEAGLTSSQVRVR